MKKYGIVILMTLNSDAKFEKTYSWFQKWYEKLGEFYNASSGKPENFRFDRLLL